MGFFNKKNERTSICGCNRTTETIRMAGTDNVSSRIKVLGSGCAKCKALERTVKEALAELGMETAVEHVTDFALIASYGIMTTPALVVDGKVVSYGKVLNKEEAKALILKARGGQSVL